MAQQQMPGAKFANILPIVLALVALAVSAFASYSSNDKDTTSRITAVEVLQKADRDVITERLNRIENKVDQILLLQRSNAPGWAPAPSRP